ncbi:MAG: CoA transferase [Candidatus Latescibacteria bacterium]|nr:CoA transferase [Candidatus Latescibacterota bacterium]NIO28359.1 CoA transferase [Candidatus Latescibacterota bacterium]NIO55908.1 CoA transferase [Candidatus Latescibacterota bacterium]NIT01872.1 CoA transferase [Candidatus Latescibacterota bacterium]
MTNQPVTDLPLSGIRVLDLSRILAGPYCTMLLGDLGAEVIKVERPDMGDDTRTWGPPFAGGESAYYLCCNRNKKSITIDLKNPRGAELVKDLAKVSDVLVENFTPGLMKRVGLDYETLCEINPRLVYCSITAYGQDGPYSNRPGYDMVLSAVGGLMWITGEKGGKPVKVGVAITDVVTGVYASGAITAALLKRERSGRGQYMDVSLLDVQVSCLANIASNYLVASQEAQRWGTEHESIVPYQVFPTKDLPIAIAVANQKLWISFCELIGKREWIDDPRFESNPKRVESREILIPLVADVMAGKTCDEWIELFVKAAIPCGPVNTMQSLFADPQVVHRGMAVEVPHATIGALRLVGNPIKYSETPVSVHLAPPLLGEHTGEIMTGVLGYGPVEIEELRKQGAI